MTLESVILLLFFVFSLSILAAKNSSCYYPAGVENRGEPCDPDALVSPCCGPGFVCLSNGLCTPGPDDRKTYRYKYYRSGCTDPSWNSSSCPQFCIGPDDSLDSGEGLQSCATNKYCCNKNYDCCQNSTNVFALDVANIVTTIPYLSSSATQTSSVPSATPSTTSSTSNNSDNGSNAVAIGVGVGVGVGGLLVILLAVLIFLRRRKNKRHAEKPPETAELENKSSRQSGSRDEFAASVPRESEEKRPHIPQHPVELENQPRYEIGRSPSPVNEKTGESSNERNNYPGRFFKEEGVYRHEVSG